MSLIIERRYNVLNINKVGLMIFVILMSSCNKLLIIFFHTSGSPSFRNIVLLLVTIDGAVCQLLRACFSYLWVTYNVIKPRGCLSVKAVSL